MPNVMVVYESRYGNTKRVGEAIIQEMRGVEGTEATLSEIKGGGLNTIRNFLRL